MCMKYINAITRCYNSVTRDNKGRICSLNNPFDTLHSQVDGENVSIGDFSILTEITIMGTSKEENVDNPIVRGDTLHFTLRLTKCDKVLENRIGVDIDKFDIDLKELKENNLFLYACYPFYNYMRMTDVDKIELKNFDTGKYVLKVLVRATDDPNDDTIQSMSVFTVL